MALRLIARPPFLIIIIVPSAELRVVYLSFLARLPVIHFAIVLLAAMVQSSGEVSLENTCEASKNDALTILS